MGWEFLGERRADHLAQFVGGEEVDVQAGLGAREVTQGEAAGVIVLEAMVAVVDVGVGGVDADAEQPAGPDAGSGVDQVLVGLLARAVLEDLNADDQLVPGGSTGHGTQVANDELASAVGSLLAQLGDRLGGDVESEQVESGVEQRDEIAPVAAADVEPPGFRGGGPRPGCPR